MSAVCRTHYATVLTERGDWSEAEAELLAAGERLALRPMQAAEAIARLGELRRRQGRVEEAGGLFDRVAFHPRAQIGHAALALDRGDPEAAMVGPSVFCARSPSPIGRNARMVSSCWRARTPNATTSPAPGQRWSSWRRWRGGRERAAVCGAVVGLRRRGGEGRRM